MRWLIILALFGIALSCIGTGYTCDRGGIEIHLEVNKEVVEKYFKKADVIPYGQTWGVRGEISVYYTDIYPVLLYVFDNGIRIQIAIKNFTVIEGLKENCELWEDPENLDAKEVTKKILEKLKEIRAIEIDNIDKIVNKVRWGCSGNCWIDLRTGKPIAAMVRGCGGGRVFILKEWKSEKIETIEVKRSFFERILDAIINFFRKILNLLR